MIKEITQFQTSDGELFSTLQLAEAHERRREIAQWIVSNSHCDVYDALNIVDALYQRYTIEDKEA